MKFLNISKEKYENIQATPLNRNSHHGEGELYFYDENELLKL